MNDDGDDDGAWLRVLDVHTPWTRVQLLVDEHAQIAVDALRAQLEADADITASERDAILARAWPLIIEKTREAFETGWHLLQAEAASRGTVH